MVLVQKWPFFQLFCLGNIGQENVFYDILDRKNAFLAYKNKKYKKSKNWHFSKGLTHGFGPKMANIPTLERRFFALEYRPILPPKKLQKWPFLVQNYGFTPLEKSQFFDFWNFLFLQLRTTFYRSTISSKTFSWTILPKEKVGKMVIIGTKPWVNLFGKMSIFQLLELLVFIA